MRHDITDDRIPDVDSSWQRGDIAMKTVAALKRELVFYRAVLGDPRTPAVSRWCLRAAVAYLLSPIDLIPDFVPVLGRLDDVIVVSMLLMVARYFLPVQVMRDHRLQSGTPPPEPAGTVVDNAESGRKIRLNDD